MKENDTKQFMTPENSCRHCGGIMRDYRGSVSCMMCGREVEHQCERCITAQREEPMRRSA